MKNKIKIGLIGLLGLASSFAGFGQNEKNETFSYVAEQFADLRILRYNVPGFNELPAKQKEMVYYLYEATLCGRDIFYDQNYKYNLILRKTIETIVGTYKGDKADKDYQQFLVYAKRFWFSNGFHHHYSKDKFFPEISEAAFKTLLNNSDIKALPVNKNESVQAFEDRITKLIFDPTIAPKKVNQDAHADMIKTSAMNFYEGVSQEEVIAFYDKQVDKNSKTPVMVGLNSKLVKENGQLVEKKWMVGGMYSTAIQKMIYWLKKAKACAENNQQKEALEKMILFYKTGNLKDFDNYNISWIKDTASTVDVVNGYIEVYNDPLGKKGSFESIVSIKDQISTKRIKAIGDQAQWFEDHSSILPEHKKKKVTGISAKVINVVVESGDAAPATPIGINLPNNEWIRGAHGSKSVNLDNIVNAYDNASGGSIVNEFYYSDEIKERIKKYGSLADKLVTDMHEVIGHASGQINPGVGQPHSTLKNYASALEEARADIVALYYLMDPKLVEIGAMPSLECGKTAYDEYITKNLLIQLARIKPGDDIEEAHMRDRSMICKWVMEKGAADNVIEKKMRDGKTFYVINDYEKLHQLFGQLLRELQRIKSEGDYQAGHDLIENYGVKVEQDLHKEVLTRYNGLHISPYNGFIQPQLTPVIKGGKIVDVKISYPTDFVEQMLYYGKNYSLLPLEN